MPAELTKPAHRSIEDIQKDYQSSCLRAGHLQYQISANSKDLALLNERLRDLNFEAVAASNAAKAAEEAAKPAAPTEVTNG